MKVVIIGSLSSAIEMDKAAEVFRNMGCDVKTPLDNQGDPLYYLQRDYISYIENCDLIVVVPKGSKFRNTNILSDLAEEQSLCSVIGESTSYELAISNRFNKNVMVWYHR